MYSFKSFVAALATAALAIAAASCTTEHVEGPVEDDYSFSAEVSAQSFGSVTVKFTAGADVAGVKYGYGSAFSNGRDLLAFEHNILSTIQTADTSNSEITFALSDAEPVSIYICSVNADGTCGETIQLNAAASPVAYELSKVSLGSFVFTVPQNISGYIGMSFLGMAASEPESWGMSAYEIVDMYASWYMFDIYGPGESGLVELNGEHDIAHYLGVVYWKEDYSYDIKIVEFTTGGIDNNANDANIEVKVENITSSTADLVFTPNDDCCAYFYRLYKKSDYQKDKTQGLNYGINPDIYIRSLVSAGGSFRYTAQTDKRTGLNAATDYILVCYPFNKNGSEGWGETKIVEFTTK